jgi:hypothetical protein
MKTLPAAVMRVQIDHLDKAIANLNIVRPHLTQTASLLEFEDWTRVASAIGLLKSIRRTLLEAAISDVTVETMEAA